MKARLASDRGSALLLMIGMTALSLAIIIGVMAASSLYLERKRLFTLADGAALAAAQSFDLSLAPTPQNPHPQLSTVSVTRGVNDYLNRIPSASKRAARLVSAGTSDSKTAIVIMQSTWHPPIVSIFMPQGLAISVTSSARSFY